VRGRKDQSNFIPGNLFDPENGGFGLTWMRKIALSTAAVFLLLALAEIFLRAVPPPAAALRHADKKAHCPDEFGTMVYCPDVRVVMNGEHFRFHLTTNSESERITGFEPVSGGREIWILGDSIITGYGIDDEKSAPFLVRERSGLRVRNLAVDGLGPAGTLQRFRQSLKIGRPLRAYYLFDYSEFADVAREAGFASSSSRRFIQRADAFFSRTSMLYCALRARPASSFVTAGSAPPIAPDHPAFGILRQILAAAREGDVDLVVILYAGGGLDGRPGLDQSYQDLVAQVVSQEKSTLLDLRSEFQSKAMQETLYIPGDGHPSEAGARIIAQGILADLSRRPLAGEAPWK
jgi:hypothetical protein